MKDLDQPESVAKANVRTDNEGISWVKYTKEQEWKQKTDVNHGFLLVGFCFMFLVLRIEPGAL